MSIPAARSITCRVDVDNRIWVLMQTDANDSRWHSFSNPQALTAFLSRSNLKCPPKCITEEQCNKLTEEGIKRIVILEKEVSKYKVLLENAQRQLGTASPALLPRTNSLPVNKVTTGTASSVGSVATDSSLINPLETKLGSYSTGLQKKFANKMSGVKRRGSGSSIASEASETAQIAVQQPSTGLARSASTNSIGNATSALGRREAPQSSVQQLKSLLRQNKPNLTSLDPYATDNSEAAEASARPTYFVGTGTPDGRSQTSTPGGSGGSGFRGAASEDDSYWTESDGSSVYDRHRDLEGNMSDDLGYNSEHSTAQAAVRPRSPVDAQPRKLRRTNSGSERVAGIALKDEASRDSTAASSVHTATSDNSAAAAGGTLQSPRRTLSADSLASLNSNSNSYSNSRSRSTVSAAKRTWAPAPEYRAEEDTCMSMRLSQDDDESRSMLFAQLGDESRLSTAGGSMHAPPAPPAAASSGPVTSLFGTIMKSVKSLFSPSESWGSTTNSSHGGQYGSYSSSRAYQTESAYTVPAPAPDLEAAVYPYIEPSVPERVMSPHLHPAGTSTNHTADNIIDVPLDAHEHIPTPVLTLDWSKVSAADQAKLKVFQDTLKKAKLPSNLETTLLRGIVTKECTPIDCAEQICNILRLSLRKNHKDGAKKGNNNEDATATKNGSAAVLSILGKISKLLSKLYSRNKKIVVAEGLIVKTICACSIMQIVTQLRLFSVRHDLCCDDVSRASLVETVDGALERLVLMLNSIFLLPADVPWILAAGNGSIEQMASLITNEKYKNIAKSSSDAIIMGSPLSQEKTHIEMFVDHLKDKFTQTAIWPVVKDSVLRYDYSYQRDLISPVKVPLPRAQRVRPSTKATPSQPDPLTSSAVPLFDILATQTDSATSMSMLPPRGRRGSEESVTSSRITDSHSATASTSASIVAGKSLLARQPSTTSSLIGALLQQTKQRNKQKDTVEDLFAGITTGGSAVAAPNAAAASTVIGGVAGASSVSITAAGVPVKRKNALLSNKPPALGHRVNMGVKKKVVISAKTIAATSIQSALNTSALTSNLRAGSSGANSSNNAGSAVDFTKTPRKAISFSQGTPQSSQDPYSFPGDGYFTSQRGSSSAKRYRDSTVIESTPMEMLQPRRSSGASSGLHLTAQSYLSSPSPEHSGSKRSRLNISGESRSSSSSSGSRHGRTSGIPLSNLLDGAEDEEEPFTPAAHWRLAAASASTGQGAFNADDDADTFHYLPPTSAHSPARSPEPANNHGRDLDRGSSGGRSRRNI